MNRTQRLASNQAPALVRRYLDEGKAASKIAKLTGLTYPYVKLLVARIRAERERAQP